jgi:predicted transcriptional regulator with HTH domain
LEQKTYPSAAEASRQLGVDKSSISKCLRGLKPQANGYKFVYYEREEENGIKDC